MLPRHSIWDTEPSQRFSIWDTEPSQRFSIWDTEPSRPLSVWHTESSSKFNTHSREHSFKNNSTTNENSEVSRYKSILFGILIGGLVAGIGLAAVCTLYVKQLTAQCMK
ncbi:unnamed protein product [Rotaria sp. Silwood2]|nr:unnamed protein product [Rotaria sp. Silwood2]CAF3215820.1 unnamed protein product [Rotaria sp. Silwood2]CAF3338576.1 unnamed protein product [Rotaria sp. Silwood2]CAF4279589.1 unnamed protein product [Rotaria sp. Silwood2]CAF4461093.1 unnamed protein product [Rotaria sp. Silwood2]